jgi:cytoskeleton protein RodZ
VSESAAGEEQRPLTVAEVAARPLPGVQLRSARETLGMTIGDVAQSIKFSPRQIEALERDEYSHLPPGPTFIRGFIRSYAKLLRLDPAPLLDALPQEAPPEPAELVHADDIGTRMPMPGNRRAWMPSLALGALAVALGALGVHYFYRGDAKPMPRSSAVAGGDAPAPLPAPAAAEGQPAAIAPPAPTAAAPLETVSPVAPPPTQTPSPVARAEPPPASPAAAASLSATAAETKPTDGNHRHHQLIFMFDSDAWVEVKDASQRIIFSQLNPGGTRQVVNGSPPFDMVIGNASQVHLQYDGHAVDLAPDTRAEVARLILQ